MKLEGESFSDIIRRLAKRGSLAECAGLWADMPNAESRALMEAAEALERKGEPPSHLSTSTSFSQVSPTWLTPRGEPSKPMGLRTGWRFSA